MSRTPRIAALLTLVLLGCSAAARAAQEPAAGAFEPIRFGDPPSLADDAPFFPGTHDDESVPTPSALLGWEHGTRLVRHDELLRCFEAWAEISPKVVWLPYGRTYEGRTLGRAVISSPANLARLDDIRRDLHRLADPRGATEEELDRIVARTPASAWMGYSIHGDEVSGTDSSLAVAWHLIAGQGEAVETLLDQLVVVVDPCMNPDGRMRILGQIEQSAGYATSLDDDSMHRGRWPWGRGNHYLFDLNRDWMVGAHPETRGRWRAVRDLPPQLFVDAHEMGSQDTYLFYPQAAPHNPNLPRALDSWHQVFGGDQGAAFDAHGWAYYTREWADAWGPFYSDAWGSLNGAVGILYEQAGTSGSPLLRDSGRVMTYRETVHHQAVSSMANLTTLAREREAVLRDYTAERLAQVRGDRGNAERAFLLVPGRHPDREADLIATLMAQGIEVHRADEKFQAIAAVDAFGRREDLRHFPGGTLLVPAAQPQGALVNAYLDFDPRIDDGSLSRERQELLRSGGSTMYDLTSWSLGQAYGVNAWWAETRVRDGWDALTSPPPPSDLAGSAPNSPAAWKPDDGLPYALAVSGAWDGSVTFAAHAMERGLAVHWAEEEFAAAGQRFPRGSLLVRRNENALDAADVARRLGQALAASGVPGYAVETGRAPDDGPDLGGQRFRLLERPRVAVLANDPVSTERYGDLWFLLDHELRLPFTVLDGTRFRSADLRRFNVLVLPSARLGRVLDDAEFLEEWIRGGGTLVACDGSARAVLGAIDALATRPRLEVLDELADYRLAARADTWARSASADASAWRADARALTNESDAAPSEPDAAFERWADRFLPQGAILRGTVDPQSWLTAGCGPELPVLVRGGGVLLAKAPARTAIRLAPASQLRVSGLLWPEARERLADSSWLTTQRLGSGQVVLFSGSPGFRMLFRSSGRLFLQAVVYGPGLGADPAPLR